MTTSDLLAAQSSSTNTIRYDTIEEFNVDSKAEYSALSCTRIASKGRNPHRRTSWKLVGNPGHELVAN